MLPLVGDREQAPYLARGEASEIELRVTAEDAILVEGDPSFRREIPGDARTLRDAIA